MEHIWKTKYPNTEDNNFDWDILSFVSPDTFRRQPKDV